MSGNCADGVCCESACDGVCESCNLRGTEGTCAADAEGSDPADECAGQAACDGSGACLYGEHLWSKKFTGATIADVAVDAQGNIVVVGDFTGNVNFGGSTLTAGGIDAFVAKFTADGTHLWSNRFGDADAQWGQRVAVDASGNIFLGGNFRGVINFGGLNLSNADVAEDIFVVKLSATGAHSWSKSFAVTGFSSDSGEVFDLVVDASGNTIFTGWVDSDVNFGGGTLPGAGGGEPYLVKLAGTGAHIWSKTFPGQSGRALATTNAGDVVWAGTFSGDTDLGGAVLSANGSDIFLARFSSSGAHMWSARFGNDYAHPHSLVIDSADRILLAGEFSTSIDFGGETMLAAGLEDGFTALFSGTGEHQWSKRFGSAPDDEVTSVAFDGADNPISAGNTSGSVDFGGGALVSAGSYDVFVGKLGVSGTHVWSRSFGDPQDQRLHALAVGPSDTLILAGRFAGIIDFGGNELLSAADDAFLAALGP